MNFSENGSNELDITMFDSNNHNILIKFREFAEKFQDQNEYVDVNDIKNLQCDNCKELLKGEIEASLHASVTGHNEFIQL